MRLYDMTTYDEKMAARYSSPVDSAIDELPAHPELTGQFADQLALLRRVVDARAIIEQAKGMLMAEHRVSAERAFELLRDKSQRTNTKLRDVAAHHVLLYSGQFTIRGTTWSR